MTPEQWQRVRNAFDDAVARSPADRAAWIQQLNLSAEEQENLRALLQSHDDSHNEFETPAAAMEAHRHLILPDLTGRLLKDRYRVERQFSSGGFAAVYLAIDEQIARRKVVLKLLLQSSDDATWVDRTFDREIQALASLQHAGVVGILDQGALESGHRFLVMPYVEGKTLAEELAQGPLSRDRAIALIRQFGSALAAAHASGIAHHDLKPQNLMVQRLPGGEEQLVILDFGIAQLREPGAATRTLTRVFGSPQYMPPEQIRGKPTFATDIYAMALVCWQMIGGGTPEQILERIGTPPASALEALLLSALDANPAARPQNAKEFAEKLTAFLKGEEASRIPKWTPALLLSLAAMGTVAVVIWRAPKEIPPEPLPISCGGATQRFVGERTSGEPVRFETRPRLQEGDGLRVECAATRAGHVYLIGESQGNKSGPEWSLLFPETKRGAVYPNERIRVPSSDRDWIRLREASSREMIHILWSEQPLDSCERLLRYANAQDQGLVTKREDAEALAVLLRQPPHGAIRITIPLDVAQK